MELWDVAPAVVYQQAVYDSQSETLVAFGPETTRVYNSARRTWEKTEPAEEPPPFRCWSALAYDSQSDRVILFGGLHWADIEFSDETWTYNSNTWTQLHPANRPSGRRFHSMVYDEAADKMVLFGGIAGNWLKEEINDEMWIYDPVAEEWSQVLPGSTAP